MNVAKASFSQMPFHHFMVTRSPNHMWAISWRDDVGDALELDPGRRVRVDQQGATRGRSRSPRFSMAPAAKSGMATMSSFSPG